eukprot:TRINITY_DN191_c0_g1_i1.p1 TRINITY_DN191_c0_g1~~TRINITY_DN191_c0_g1_i1.p1  ORF type:complete len:685 (+),score=202.22 TRINITY_DN191_c0_g1_i1:49-2103(+)
MQSTPISRSTVDFSPTKNMERDKGNELYERGLEFLRTRDDKIAQTEREREEELTRELQKTPKISKASRQLIIHRPKDFSKSNTAWQNTKERKLEEIRQELLAVEAEQYTFKPELKFYHKTEGRLSIFDDWDEQTAHYMTKKNEFPDPNCTFSPKIDNKSSRIAKRLQQEEKEKMEQMEFIEKQRKKKKSRKSENNKPSMIDEFEEHAGNRMWIQMKLEKRKKQLEANCIEQADKNIVDEEGNILFKPTINPTLEDLEDKQENNNIDVFEKLFSKAMKTPDKKILEDTTYTHTPKLSKGSEKILREKQLQPVLERLFDEGKKEKFDSYAEKEVDVSQSQIQLDPAKREELRKEFEERNSRILEEKQKDIEFIVKEREEKIKKEYTFTPTLSKGTKEILEDVSIDRKDLYDRAMELEKQKLQEIEKMRKKRLAEEVKDCTFKPVTSNDLKEERRKKLRDEKQKKESTSKKLSFMEKKRIEDQKSLSRTPSNMSSKRRSYSTSTTTQEKPKGGYSGSDWSYTSAALSYFKDRSSPVKSKSESPSKVRKTPKKHMKSPPIGGESPLTPIKNPVNTSPSIRDDYSDSNSQNASQMSYSSIASELFEQTDFSNRKLVNQPFEATNTGNSSSPLGKRIYLQRSAPISPLSHSQTQELKALSETSESITVDSERESKKEHVLSMLEQWKSSR